MRSLLPVFGFLLIFSTNAFAATFWGSCNTFKDPFHGNVPENTLELSCNKASVCAIEEAEGKAALEGKFKCKTKADVREFTQVLWDSETGDYKGLCNINAYVDCR